MGERNAYSYVFMMDQYLPGVNAVLNGETPPEAIAHVENEDGDA